MGGSLVLAVLRDFSKMTLKNEKSGFRCMFFFGYCGLSTVFNPTVLIDLILQWLCSESSERVCLKVCFFCRVFSFFLYFYEGGCIPNILNVVHNPKITLDVKMKVQVCISAIAVSFIKDSAAEHSQW